MTDHSSSHKRLFQLASGRRTPWLLTGLFSLLSAAAIIALMYGLSIAVDAVFMGGLGLPAVTSALLLIVGAVIARGLIFWISELVTQKAASEIKLDIRKRLFRTVQQRGPVWTETQSSGELAATAVEGVEKLDAYYARFIPAGIHMAILPSVIAVFVFWIDWISGLILVVTGPLIPVFMSLIGMRARDKTQKQWATLRRLSTHFLDAVQGLRTLKLYNHTGKKHEEIEKISDRFRKSTMGVLKVAFLSGFILELFASLATALVAVEIGVRLIEGQIAFQTGLFVLLLAPEYYLPFRLFGARHHAGMEGTEAASRIFEILEDGGGNGNEYNNCKPSPTAVMTTGRLSKDSGTSVLPNPPLCSPMHTPFYIQIEGLEYSYPSKMSPVLTDCSLDILPGKTTALVGKSGSGKTTLIRLLTRQITPDKGAITVQGISLDRIEEQDWLQSISVVNQNSWFFDDSIFANLLVSRPDATETEVVDACKAAGAHSFISGLPEGYRTRTGEFAARLSGGERQRISIARAFLRNSPFLILDEPSSALDPESEAIIGEALDRLFGDRTTLVIAHRLSTVRRADRILVLDDGKISAEGNHQQLLAGCKLYSQMAKSYCYNSL